MNDDFLSGTERYRAEMMLQHYMLKSKKTETSNATPVRPLTISCSESVSRPKHHLVTIQIEPWVSAETLLKEYHKIQRALLDEPYGEPEGRQRARALQDRDLQLICFLLEQAENGGVDLHDQIDLSAPPRPVGGGWRKLLNEWNQSVAEPQWKYPEDRNGYKNFRQSCLRLWKRFAHPYRESR